MFNLPSNRGNTCFLDSVLVALFYTKVPFLDRALAMQVDHKTTNAFSGPWKATPTPEQDLRMKDQFKEVLQQVCFAIQRPQYKFLDDLLTELDYIVKVYQPLPLGEVKHEGTNQFQMNSAVDFAGFVMCEILNLETKEMRLTLEETFAYHGYIFRRNIRHQAPFLRLQPGDRTLCVSQLLEPDTPVEVKLTPLEQQMCRVKRNQKRVIQSRCLTDATFLVVGIDRLMYHDGKSYLSKQYVLPDAVLSIGDHDLFLYSVVVYVKLHYVTYLCHDDVWFRYDDLKKDLEIIGDYVDMAGCREVRHGLVLCCFHK